MGLTRSPWINRIWVEFEARALEICGVFIQAFDAKGQSFHHHPSLPPLCALLDRHPTSRAVCLNDCYRKVALAAECRAIVPARCYAGLSYRLVPIAVRQEPPVLLQVGRVLTDLFGEEQVSGFSEKYGLERHEYFESLRRSRHLSVSELDRVAGFAGRLAASISMMQRRLENHRSRVKRHRYRVLQLESQVGAFHQMADKILAARSVEEVLPLALEAAMLSLHARRGSILLAEAERGQVTAQAFRGEHAELASTIKALHPDSVSHRVFYNRRSLLVQDADREFGHNSERQFPYSTRSFVSIPLRENGHSLGVLHLTERENNDIFTPQDLALLEKLGIQAASAISKVKLEEEVRQLRVKSETDPLTGVHNRRYLDEHLIVEFDRAKRFGQPLAAVMIDIDDFKLFNDGMGHECGDLMLRELVSVIRRKVRSIDVLSRFGGDEFLLLLPGTDQNGAFSTAEKIRARVEASRFPGQDSLENVKFTVSCGVATYPGMASSAMDLLYKADQALLGAKKSGKNTVLSAKE